MFFKKTTLEPKPLVIDKTPEGPSASYRELAKKAGFDGVEAALATAGKESMTSSLRRFLSENGIAVYEDLAVRKYMDSITPRGMYWWWLSTKTNKYSGYVASHRWSYEEKAYQEERASESYSKPIPEAVLITMGKIREQFPSVEFEVTDIRKLPKPDPFLRVSVDSINWFIIERWDEPKFRQ